MEIKGPNGEKIHSGGPKALGVAHGLVIYGAEGALAEKLLKSKLTNLAKPLHPRLPRPDIPFLYSPEKDMPLGHVDNEIETEILWRYVNMKDTVVVFNSYQEFLNDLEYRKTICAKAKAVIDPGFGVLKANPAQWDLGRISNGPAFQLPVNPPVTWITALNDVFAGGFDVQGSPLYQIGCKATAACLHLHAFVQVMTEGVLKNRIVVAKNAAKLGFPDPEDDRLLTLTRRSYAVPPMSVGDYRAHWVPGDWGYINNLSIGDDNSDATGEHVIYVGGSFDTSYVGGNGTTGFKDTAQFFGHRLDDVGGLVPARIVQSLQAWVDAVDALSPNVLNDVEVQTYRYIMSQP